MFNPLANGKIQGLFKALECFSSTFQGKFYFQELFETVLYIQVLFKPVQTQIYLFFTQNSLLIIPHIVYKPLCTKIDITGGIQTVIQLCKKCRRYTPDMIFLELRPEG